ncbi:hypothetical protein [Agrobacterium sp. NPDC089420]|uniref:hypothetical protein n=1 Tax=Agrobacterium sp. NPDC089420 TaxID=3363918 RepID=UPI00384D8E6F
MHIGYFEYDNRILFFGRASDGSITSAFDDISDARNAVAYIEGQIQNRVVETTTLRPTLQAHRERSIHKIEYDYDLRDWVEDFVIISFNDPETGLVYIALRRAGMAFTAKGSSLSEVNKKCIQIPSGPKFK